MMAIRIDERTFHGVRLVVPTHNGQPNARRRDIITRQDLAGTVCRIVQLNITMSELLAENGSGAAVDVVVPDDAGRTDEIETE